jgi:hypothetical protein
MLVGERKQPPNALALPLHPELLIDGRGTIEHASCLWLREPVRETTISAEHCDFSLSLLQLDDNRLVFHEDAESEPDTYDGFVPPERRREW